MTRKATEKTSKLATIDVLLLQNWLTDHADLVRGKNKVEQVEIINAAQDIQITAANLDTMARGDDSPLAWIAESWRGREPSAPTTAQLMQTIEELRDDLAAVRNAAAYIARSLTTALGGVGVDSSVVPTLDRIARRLESAHVQPFNVPTPPADEPPAGPPPTPTPGRAGRLTPSPDDIETRATPADDDFRDCYGRAYVGEEAH